MNVAITGLGLVSCLGEGREAHAAWPAEPVIDETGFAPFPIHPLPPLKLEEHIPRREFRQMEAWQRLGTYAAGLAIADAGAKDLVAQMDLMVAAGGGERDTTLDATLLAEILTVPPSDREAWLNRKLGEGLRPTLFLAQLSNLLAGSISILHNVAGSSRTFLGEEAAGAEALRVAHARVADGTSRLMLVGAAWIAGRWDNLLTYAPWLHQNAWARTAEREKLVPGSGAAFLVLEPLDAALARGATPLALLEDVRTDMAPLETGTPDVSAAPFQAPATALAVADATGHLMEAAFPMAVAMAALTGKRSVAGFGHRHGHFAATLKGYRA
jgi:3-oxoacyl-[acyl-carrier-protein] synthase II